jgi:hypothetical protein
MRDLLLPMNKWWPINALTHGVPEQRRGFFAWDGIADRSYTLLRAADASGFAYASLEAQVAEPESKG